MTNPGLAEYQKASCPFCRENIPHYKHVTDLELSKLGITIGTREPVLEPEMPATKTVLTAA